MHLLVLVPPKVSVSDIVGTVKDRTAIPVFNTFRVLKHRPYWGNRFWARGYCVGTMRLRKRRADFGSCQGKSETLGAGGNP